MRFMKIEVKHIFNNNIKFVEYSRSGVIYYTNDLEELYELKSMGWKYNICSKGFRIIPPSVTICDISECKKVEQYKNVILNLAYYKFLNNLIQNNKLNNFIKNILSEDELYYKNFDFHVSSGPILETEIKIEGTDLRINTLKQSMLIKFMLSKEYNDLYFYCKKRIVKNTLLEKKSEKNASILKFYNQLEEKCSLIKKINIKREFYSLDLGDISDLQYDKILFIPFGCYKFLNQFINEKNYKKAMFLEFHLDKEKPFSHKLYYDSFKNKKILIIDSVYSGKTLLKAKQMVKSEGGTPILLGINPKSKNIINILDYALILNKVYDCKKIRDTFNFENIYINTFSEAIKNDF